MSRTASRASAGDSDAGQQETSSLPGAGEAAKYFCAALYASVDVAVGDEPGGCLRGGGVGLQPLFRGEGSILHQQQAGIKRGRHGRRPDHVHFNPGNGLDGKHDILSPFGMNGNRRRH